MSHFSVLVVTKTGSDEEIEAVLQPFHEYECTGTKDEYVVWVDETEEKTEEFNNDTIPMICEGDKPLFSKYDDQAKKFWRREGIGTSSNDKLELPVGFSLKDIQAATVYGTLEEYLRDWCGCDDDNFIGSTVGRHTNPNAQWDWWVVGGRWSNRLLSVDGVKGDHWIKSQVDFSTQISTAEKEAESEYNKTMLLTNGEPFKTWGFVRESMDNIEAARGVYGDQPAVKAIRAEYDNPFYPVDDFALSKEDYIKLKGREAIGTFAALVDGKWMQKGDMGWFGMVSDEDDSWYDGYQAMLDSIPDDHYLTVVDCHI